MNNEPTELQAQIMERLDVIESKIDRLLVELMTDPDLKPYLSARQRARRAEQGAVAP